MGCTQVDTITGPIRANTFFIPSDRRERLGRNTNPVFFREGSWISAWSSQPNK